MKTIKEKLNASVIELRHSSHDEAVEKLSRMIYRHAIAKTRGLTGFEFGEAVQKIMDDLGHPHARYTLEQIRGNYRQGLLTTREFGLNCARAMSYRVAENLFLS